MKLRALAENIERYEKVDQLLHKAPEGGFGGRDERRIERHREQAGVELPLCKRHRRPDEHRRHRCRKGEGA